MTDATNKIKDESGISELTELGINELRQMAKLLKIPAQRDWNITDFARAILTKQRSIQMVEALGYNGDGSQSALPPGHAKILIHRDPTPGAANSPIPLGLNGRTIFAPRGVEFVAPIEYVLVLADAKQKTMRQVRAPNESNPEGLVEMADVQSYPFQVIDLRPHTAETKFKSEVDQRSRKYAKREAFWKEHGKWPTDGELVEWERLNREEQRIVNKINSMNA